MSDKKVKIFKLIMLIVFIAIMIFLTIQFLPIFKSIATEEGRLTFKEEIEGLGGKGVFAIIRTYDSSNISSNTTSESQ